MTTKGKRVYSDWPIPPGEGLQEEAEFRGISPQEMATLCGESVENIEAVYRGALEIAPDLAEKLEKVLGIGAYIWLGLEADYQETLLRTGESRPE
ncbi:MAG: hypothetical protein OXR67_13535 [Chloroflexota bacterium]|nr:hypothetical protein [Chloroflexota bacterium]